MQAAFGGLPHLSFAFAAKAAAVSPLLTPQALSGSIPPGPEACPGKEPMARPGKMHSVEGRLHAPGPRIGKSDAKLPRQGAFPATVPPCPHSNPQKSNPPAFPAPPGNNGRSGKQSANRRCAAAPHGSCRAIAQTDCKQLLHAIQAWNALSFQAAGLALRSFRYLCPAPFARRPFP